MNESARVLLERRRQEQSVKSMYYNRYLLIRYVMAVIFFANLYWFICMIMVHSFLHVIPLLLMMILTISMAEQVKIYSAPTNDARYTKYVFLVLLWINVLLAVMACFTAPFGQLYPFLINENKSRGLVLAILFLQICLILVSLNRLRQIKNNEDKHYYRIQQYEKMLQRKRGSF
ncbi:hypothetical protein B9L19_00455 [Geobacillus thermocatenulatus]|uniref:Uncharacterized protein n=1 Tax=Geobacillus thermocatenulatus TaxID=33938 RepID=A0A226Q8B6_9BACL|nr:MULTISPECIES: hypothetical protein [Geobacillus]ASS97891.1 hypothetical protein GT3921_01765 [Geobacillus thermocatenulatus]KLR74699.1 hypothetical protein ABH20_04265 [Geobacillus sp. T6]OXB88636.1 hypothetical protein B9L19_00455 [Geobacillus thermocatenulatus]RAN31177.1 hypothetical protein VC88_00580 [Geobacillus sp. A8]